MDIDADVLDGHARGKDAMVKYLTAPLRCA